MRGVGEVGGLEEGFDNEVGDEQEEMENKDDVDGSDGGEG